MSDLQLHPHDSQAASLKDNVTNAVSTYFTVDGIKTRFRSTLMALALVPLVTFFLFTLLLGIVGLFLWLFICGGSAWMCVKMLKARGRALREKDVEIIPGIARFVAWDPTEGVLLLKNKRIFYSDDNPSDGGGLVQLFPFMGEELALRVPLEIQTLQFADEKILTREYISLKIRCGIYWKIVNIEPFYMLVSREVHHRTDRLDHSVTRDTHRPRLEAAEQWLQNMAEEETRRVFSQVSTGLLLASRLADDLDLQGNRVQAATPSEGQYEKAAEGLADLIFHAIKAKIGEYGLEIHRVALQQVELPEDICRAAAEAARSAYIPLMAQRQAAADATLSKARLQADAEVLGSDAVAARELLRVSPNSPIGGLADFLNEWVANGMTRNPAGARSFNPNTPRPV